MANRIFQKRGNYIVGTCPVGGLYRGTQEREQQESQKKGQQATGGRNLKVKYFTEYFNILLALLNT